MSSDNVLEPKLDKVKISDLKLDPANPNKMNLQQMQGLEKSIKTFGNVVPIVIDSENNVIDGEHRLLVYRDKLKLSEIPAFRLSVNSDAERKLVRQALNKLKGFIDPEKDVAEMLEIQNSGLLNDLSDLIAMDQRNIQAVIESVQMPHIPTPQSEDEEEFGDDDTGSFDQSTSFDGYQQQESEQQQRAYILTIPFANSREYDSVISKLESINASSLREALLEVLGLR